MISRRAQWTVLTAAGLLFGLVCNARVTLIAAGAAPASSATTPGGQSTVPNAAAATPGTSRADVQATTPAARGWRRVSRPTSPVTIR